MKSKLSEDYNQNETVAILISLEIQSFITDQTSKFSEEQEVTLLGL